MEVELEERERGVIFFLFFYFLKRKCFSSLEYLELGDFRKHRVPIAVFLWTEITWGFFFSTLVNFAVLKILLQMYIYIF